LQVFKYYKLIKIIDASSLFFSYEKNEFFRSIIIHKVNGFDMIVIKYDPFDYLFKYDTSSSLQLSWCVIFFHFILYLHGLFIVFY